MAGLAKIAPTLADAGPDADADAGRCAERVLASVAESAAVLPAAAGHQAEAVRVFAAATAWRAGNPRSVPETMALAEFPARTRTALGGTAAHAREEAAGAALTPSRAAALVVATTNAAVAVAEFSGS